MSNTKSKKKWIGIIIAIVLVVSCIPVRVPIKDGGSIRYQAILYSVTKVHEMPMEEGEDYRNGTRVCILGIPVFDISK